MGKPLCEVCGDHHEKWQAHKFVANKESVANRSERPVANKSVDALRVKLWRQANRERYNARERERMRKNRAKEKLGEQETDPRAG